MKHFFIFFLFLTGYLQASAQDTTYYDQNNNKVATLAAADHYQVILRNPADSNRVTQTLYDHTGQVTSVTHYSDYVKSIRGGVYEDYYKDGKLHTQANFVSDTPEGELKTFWEDGTPKRDDFYHDGKFIRGKCFDASGKPVPHSEYQKLPSFKGGENALMNYLMHSILYPKKSRRKNIQGNVVVRFVVEKDGRIDHVEVAQHLAEDIDAEAIRVISGMPRWTPGALDGETVAVQYSLPLRFVLVDDSKKGK